MNYYSKAKINVYELFSKAAVNFFMNLFPRKYSWNLKQNLNSIFSTMQPLIQLIYIFSLQRHYRRTKLSWVFCGFIFCIFKKFTSYETFLEYKDFLTFLETLVTFFSSWEFDTSSFGQTIKRQKLKFRKIPIIGKQMVDYI